MHKSGSTIIILLLTALLACFLAVTAVGKLSGSRTIGSSTVDTTDAPGDPLTADDPVQNAKDAVNALNEAIANQYEELP